MQNLIVTLGNANGASAEVCVLVSAMKGSKDRYCIGRQASFEVSVFGEQEGYFVSLMKLQR